jgi:hypothetical protein
VRSAVGDREATADFVVSGTAGESRLAAAADAGSTTVVTPVTSIDAFCAARGVVPSFVKVDVEGWELAVLRGARDTIRECPDLALFVEMHPSLWPIVDVTKEELLEEMRDQGLVVEPLAPADDPWAVEGVCVRLRRA